jgi:hypothetical protein
VEIEVSGSPVSLSGVHNGGNEIAYVVWFWERGIPLTDAPDASLAAKTKKRRSGVRRFIRRKA